jgi:hypothetical protein
LPCWWDVQTAEYKNSDKKSNAYDTLAKNCGGDREENTGVENSVPLGTQGTDGFPDKREFSKGCLVWVCKVIVSVSGT